MFSLAQEQPQSQMKLQSLFPFPVGFFDYDKEFTKTELVFLRNLEQRSNEGNTSSASTNVLSYPELENLKEFVFKCVDEYFKEIYRPLFEVNLRVTQSWTNYTNKDQYHHKHRHSNSFVSGVFYIETDEKDKIIFYKPIDQSLRITPKEHVLHNSESWWFEAKQKTLLLFPSNLEHMVDTKKTEGTRISLSFNTFPIGVIGDRVALNEAIIGKVAGDE